MHTVTAKPLSLRLSKVEPHQPLDIISAEEHRHLLRIQGSIPHLEGKPFATALVLEHEATFEARIDASMEVSEWGRILAVLQYDSP
jgi:hypothetical protein